MRLHLMRHQRIKLLSQFPPRGQITCYGGEGIAAAMAAFLCTEVGVLMAS
jgi:hypothetical protein